MCNQPLKKLMAAVLCLLLCLTAVGTAYAKDVAYTIKEIDNMQLTIDSEMMAVTRSSEASDSYFTLNGNDYGKVMKNMKDGNIYLQATDSRQSILLTVSMFENDDTHKIDNYNLLSNTDLEKIVTGYRDNAQGTTYTASTVDELANDILWIDFEFRASVGSNVYKQYQANTVVNGKNVSITIQRNGGDVIASDYKVLKNVVASVKFGNAGLPRNLMMYVIIGAAVLVIIILILVIVLAKRAGRRRKKQKNDKIIRQLAGEYSSGRSNRSQRKEPAAPVVEIPKDSGADEVPVDVDATRSFDMSQARQVSRDAADRYDDAFDDDDYPTSRPVKSYTDEEIARLLGDTEDDENFTETLPVNEAASALTEEDVESVDNSLLADNFHAVEDEAEKTVEDDLAEIEAARPLKNVRDIFSRSSAMRTGEAAPQAGAPGQEEAPAADEPAEEVPAAEEPAEEAPSDAPEAAEHAEEPGVEKNGENEAREDEVQEDETVEEAQTESEQEALDDYNNDEVLVREEARRNKFSDSSDFFEEAPGKQMGVISREEIEDAEEFDVITEVEQKAEEVAREPERREQTKGGVGKLTKGLRGFGKHCGYFAVNVSREVKRSRNKKKRKKAEEERRRRAEQRAAQQKAQTQNGGLVQMKRRGEKRRGGGKK